MISSISLGGIITAIGCIFAAGGAWNTQAALPGDVSTLQQAQQDNQKATNERFEGVQQDISDVKQDVARVEGKVDTVITLLRGRK
jgi:hypothetical protein